MPFKRILENIIGRRWYHKGLLEDCQNDGSGDSSFPSGPFEWGEGEAKKSLVQTSLFSPLEVLLRGRKSERNENLFL